MFIVIKNENSSIINNLSINVIKTLVGEFTRKDLDNELYMVEYDKVIVDITCIKNYYDDNYLYSFLEYFSDPSKVIILLDDNFASNSKLFLSNLIKRGYYNIATSDGALSKLLERNNTFDDVKDYMEGYDFLKSDSIVSGKEKNDFHTDKKIIGIENGSSHAGATTLMFMLVKYLSKSYRVKGIEMNGDDSLFFNDDRVVSCSSRSHLETVIMSLRDVDVFVVDLNGSDASSLCSCIIYLIEPGRIKVNKLVKGDRDWYNNLIGRLVVVNRSNLNDDDLKDLAYETKFNIVGNIPNLNERSDDFRGIDSLAKFLMKGVKKKKGFFNIFR